LACWALAAKSFPWRHGLPVSIQGQQSFVSPICPAPGSSPACSLLRGFSAGAAEIERQRPSCVAPFLPIPILPPLDRSAPAASGVLTRA